MSRQLIDMGNPNQGAAAAIQPRQPSSLHNLGDGDLADELRGQTFALERAKDRVNAITDELERRKLTAARGKSGFAERHDTKGLLDFKRLRAEMGDDFCARFTVPGSQAFWSVRTLTADERGANGVAGR